jgi:NADPH:quinone reductase-like Zn-dependent oxidoreductase
MHVPKDSALAMEGLCAAPLCAITAGQGMLQPGKGLGLALQESGKGDSEWVLVYGGSTTSGCLWIQLRSWRS